MVDMAVAAFHMVDTEGTAKEEDLVGDTIMVVMVDMAKALDKLDK